MSKHDASTLDESKWHSARLIPTTGLTRQQEQENRATSVLLAVMHAVPEFGSSLLSYGRAPAGRINTFVEVPFKDPDNGADVRPDGLVAVRRGKTNWNCLVEVKTGRATLERAQLESYGRVANQHGIDAVLTISNEIASSAGECPIQFEKRLLRKVNLFHLSWFRILTEAVLAHEHRGVSDPDQAWILAELIHYLQHPKSGAGDFEDLGQHWTAVRDGARHRTLQPTDPAVRDVTARWEEYIQYLCLRLCQHLGRDVLPVYPRKLDTQARLDGIAQALSTNGRMSATIRVPDAAGPVGVEADLQARLVTLSLEVKAPKDGRPKTQINWLLRQLREAPDDLRVEVGFARSKQTSARLLGEVRSRPEQLLLASDLNKEPRGFVLSLAGKMGTKRSKGPKSFVGESEKQLFEFYGKIVQGIRPWTPRAPRLPDEADPSGSADAVSSMESDDPPEETSHSRASDGEPPSES